MKYETNRLILRNWQETDIDDLIEGLNNLNVSKWLTLVPYPYLKENAEEWIKYCKKMIWKIIKTVMNLLLY